MYQIFYPSGTVKKDGVVVDPTTPAWADYVAFLEANGTPQPNQDAVSPYPQIIVSAWQLRRALNALNIRGTVETAVTNSTNQDLQDGWHYASTFASDHPMIVGMRTALNMTEDQMYQVFTLAGSM